MAKTILVANWKSHPESPEGAKKLLVDYGKKRTLFKKLNFHIAPPSVHLALAREKAGGYAGLASQGFPTMSSGTHTGHLTVEMLKGLGVKTAVIGHSEERALGETDESVSRKVREALRAGITPLVCVGEKERDEEGEHLVELYRQVKDSLAGLKKKDSVEKLMVAYEPVWAVGKRAKRSIDAAELGQMSLFIRKILTDMFGREKAEKITILYGGSVDSTNARALLEAGGVRGFLVGRASLDAAELVRIAEEII